MHRFCSKLCLALGTNGSTVIQTETFTPHIVLRKDAKVSFLEPQSQQFQTHKHHLTLWASSFRRTSPSKPGQRLLQQLGHQPERHDGRPKQPVPARRPEDLREPGRRQRERPDHDQQPAAAPAGAWSAKDAWAAAKVVAICKWLN